MRGSWNINFVTTALSLTRRHEWEQRAGSWKKQQRARAGSGEPFACVPPELRCPAWCSGYTRKEVVPFEVLPIVASPVQEVGKAGRQACMPQHGGISLRSACGGVRGCRTREQACRGVFHEACRVQ